MELTIQDLGALGELLGSVAVLVTLIYLALQTRQNTAAIQAQIEVATISANTNHIMSVATSSELADAIRQDRDKFADHTTADVQVTYQFEAAVRLFAWEFQQSQQGLFTTQEELVMASVVRGWLLDSHIFPEWWEGRKPAYPPEFVEFVEEQRPKAA